MKQMLWITMAMLILGFGVPRGWGTTKYVDINWSSGTYDGSSWANAATNLRAILDAAAMSDQVWVAQGAYYPTNGSDSNATFLLKNSMALYGGFTNGMTTLGERNWTNYGSILSGDLGALGVITDNCIHVATCHTNIILDGFTIKMGFNATSSGGGVRFNTAGSSIVANCTFISNYAYTVRGGGMFLYGDNRETVVSNCRFIANSANIGGGLAMIYGVPKVIDCLFQDNVATNAASSAESGAFDLNSLYAGSLITNCTFIRNTVYGHAGAIYGLNSTTTVANCIFTGNRAPASECIAGGIYVVGPMLLKNCVLSSNYASYGGGLCFYYTNSPPIVSNCTFAGNVGRTGGGAYVSYGSPKFVNCGFMGNIVNAYHGGAIWNNGGGTCSVINCTFTGNRASNPGISRAGAICLTNGAVAIANCVFWTNSAVTFPNEIDFGNRTSIVSYTAIPGGLGGPNVNTNLALVIDGGGNINTNPLFADTISGIWDANHVYDANRDQTTLTDSNATWIANEHVGKTVRPNVNDNYYQFYIVSNGATTLTVWGCATSGGKTFTYNIIDIHEKSRMGRWTTQGWVRDATNSPCIDAGDPNAAYAAEPRPNGRRINMGRYGNTPEASMTFIPAGTIYSWR